MEKLCKCGEERLEMFTSSHQNCCKDCRKLSREEAYTKVNKPHWDMLNRHWRPGIALEI